MFEAQLITAQCESGAVRGPHPAREQSSQDHEIRMARGCGMTALETVDH